MGQSQSHQVAGERDPAPPPPELTASRDLSLSAAERKEYEAVFDENDALLENNAILRAIVDALHEDVEELQERVEDVQRRNPVQCPLCGLQLQNEAVEKRHMAFHRYEINVARAKNGLKPYALSSSAPSGEHASTTPLPSNGKKGGDSLNLLTLRSPTPPKKKARRRRRLSEFRDSFADDESSPRVVRRTKLYVTKRAKAAPSSRKKSKPKQPVHVPYAQRRITRAMAAKDHAWLVSQCVALNPK